MLSTLQMRLSSDHIYKDIVELKQLSPEPIARLCSNESPLGPNPKVINALSHALRTVDVYPDPNASDLKEVLAYQHQLDPEAFLVGNGSTEILELIIRSHVHPDSHVLIPEYSYPLYERLVKQNGANPYFVPAHDWRYDVDSLYRSIKPQTTAICLANPNNPTGAWIESEHLKDFLDHLPPRILVIIDEAYYEFMATTPGYESAIPLVKKHKNLVVTRTFSKAYGLAGLRIGYAVAHPERIQKSSEFKQSANVNCIAQYAAIIACKDSEYPKAVVEEVTRNREILASVLHALKIEYVPTLANFLLVKTTESAQTIYQKLRQHRVIIKPMDQCYLPFHIRVSIGTYEDIRRFCIAIEKEMLSC